MMDHPQPQANGAQPPGVVGVAGGEPAVGNAESAPPAEGVGVSSADKRRGRAAPHRLLRWLRSANLIGAAFGPVFQADIAVASRRWSTYLHRIGVVALMGAIVVLSFVGTMSTASDSAAERIERASSIASSFTLSALGILMGVMTLTAIVLTSGAFIQERKARTMSAVATSPLTAADLVLGKLSSRLMQILLLILLCAPILLLVRVYGGVRADMVLRCTAVILASAVMAGSIALMYSAWHRHEWSVMLMTLLTYGLLNAAMPVVVWFITWQAGTVGPPPPWALSMVFLSVPSSFVVAMTQEMLPPGTPFADKAWVLGVIWALALSIAVNLVTIVTLRRVILADAAGWQPGVSGFLPSTRRRLSKKAIKRLESVAQDQAASDSAPVEGGEAPKPPRGAKREREVTGNPVQWREGNVALLRGVATKVIMGLILLGLAYFYIRSQWDFVPSHMVVVQVALALYLFCACTAPGNTIAGERDTGSLEVLLTTPMTSKEIVLGKVLGTLRRLAPLPLFIVGHVAVFTVLGFIHWWTLVHTVLCVVPIGVFMVCMGVFFSTVCRRARSASSRSLGVMVLLWAVIPFGAMVLIQSTGIWMEESVLRFPATLWMMGLPPFVMGESLSTGVNLAGGTEISFDWPSYDEGYAIPPLDIEDDAGGLFALWQMGSGLCYLLGAAGFFMLASARLRKSGQRAGRSA